MENEKIYTILLITYLLLAVIVVVALTICVVINFKDYLKEKRLENLKTQALKEHLKDFKEREKEMGIEVVKLTKENYECASDILETLKEANKKGFKYITKDESDGEIDLWKVKPNKSGFADWYILDCNYRIDMINLTSQYLRLFNKENQNFRTDVIYDFSGLFEIDLENAIICPRLEEYIKKEHKKEIDFQGFITRINATLQVEKIIQNKPYTIIKWQDGTTTKAKCNDNDSFDLRVGFAIAFTKKFFNNNGLDKVLREKLVLGKDKEVKPVIPNGKYKVRIIHPNYKTIRYGCEYIIISDNSVIINNGMTSFGFIEKEKEEHISNLTSLIKNKDIELVKIEPQAERFDLDKELKNWGLLPNRKFRIKEGNYQLTSLQYFVDTNKKISFVDVENGNVVLESNYSLNKLIFDLINKKTTIVFVEEELDKQLKDFGIKPYRNFGIITHDYKLQENISTDFVYFIDSKNRLYYFTPDKKYSLLSNQNLEELAMAIINNKAKITFFDK